MRGRLERSRRVRVFAGVCGGLAGWLGWRPWIVRVVFVVGSLIPVLPGALVYALLWLIVPLEAIPGPAGDGLPRTI
jgi:phage shock protein C